jgi:RNA polymerase sigma-70 factor (ECF subfamily)
MERNNKDKIELLVREIQSGKNESFDELIRLTMYMVWANSMRLTMNEEDAKDLSQMVYIKVFKGINMFKGKSNFITWLYRIKYNTYIDILRKNQINNNFVEIDEEADIIEYNENIEERIEKEIDSEIMKKAVLMLKPIYREVLFLKEIENKSYKEIAEIVGISRENVGVILFRARNLLKKFYIKLSGK